MNYVKLQRFLLNKQFFNSFYPKINETSSINGRI
jgi:hypothetical protein